jgi:GT2 family glycosyltransferase
MRPWPLPPGVRRDEPAKAGVVAVNYNTRDLIARLLFGLRCVLAPGAIQAVVVVDNASTDGLELPRFGGE